MSLGPPTPTAPDVPLSGLAFSQAIIPFRSSAGNVMRVMIDCGVSAISAIDSKSFTTS